MKNYFEVKGFHLQLDEQSLHKGRSVRDGHARGFGLQFMGLPESVLEDPIYQEAMALAQGRTIQAENCRMNLFLLAKYFLPQIVDQSSGGSIVEFGSFRGGSAIFLASVCRSLGLNVKVYGLDTFEGMPPTDKRVDAHNAGDFAGVDLNELRAFVKSSGLSERLEFIQGIFEATAPALLARIPPVLLAHIDCDVYASVAFAWDVVKPYMANGGYVVFDDAIISSCLGATEAVEDFAIRRDGLNCEQIWPHFVFRAWNTTQPSANAAVQPASGETLNGQFLNPQRAENADPNVASNSAPLEAVRRENARLQQQYLKLADELSEAREDVRESGKRLSEYRARIQDLSTRYGTLREQVSLAKLSRWLRLGRLFGVGPKFDSTE